VVVNHGMKVRYYHDEVGVNSRLDSIQAAVLSVKLKNLDSYHKSRNYAAEYYDNALSKIEGFNTPLRVQNSTHVFHQYTLKVGGNVRDELRDFLIENGIPAMIYYPVPLHQQKAYRDERYKDGDFPIAEKLANTVLSLPMHSELDEEQLNYITSTIKQYLKK